MDIKDILLSEQEIIEVTDRYDRIHEFIGLSHYGFEHMLNMVQGKKFVEWLNGRWISYEENTHTGTTRMTFAISEDDWQALKQALGMEATDD